MQFVAMGVSVTGWLGLALAIPSTLAALWKWYRDQRAEEWPAVVGTIEACDISKSKESSDGSPEFKVTVCYRYSAGGSDYQGWRDRLFDSNSVAEQFCRSVTNRDVRVHYNPNHPSDSDLLPDDLDAALGADRPDLAQLPQAARPGAFLFASVSACGLTVSLIANGFAQFNQIASDYPWLFTLLLVGCIVMMFPLIFALGGADRGLADRNDLGVVLRYVPDWAKALVVVVACLAGVSAYTSGLTSVSVHPGETLNPDQWKLASGVCGVSYSLQLAGFTALLSKKPRLSPPRP